MAGIIKRDFHVFAAESFVDELNTEGNQENSLYLGLGRNAVWGDENNPDLPVDSKDSTTDFWTNVLALSLINPTNVSLVVPKKVWTSGATSYTTFDSSLSSASAFAENFYVINSSNIVYEITTVPADTVANPATIEPVGASDVADQGDGYAYRYMYQIEVVDQKFITGNWMPVEFETNYNVSDPERAHLVLGAKYAMVHAEISNTGIIPTTTAYDYRQISIIRNPVINDALANDDKTVATGGEYISFTNLEDGTEPTKIVRNLGELMYLENKRVINRDPDQSEEIKLILEF